MKVVLRPGVFDLFHIGHLNCITKASSLGDKLIVAIQDDREVEKNKGVKPMIPLADRMEIISNLRKVDLVLSYKSSDLSPILKAMDINVLAVGEDYGADGDFPEQQKTIEFCKDNQIEIFKTKRTKGVSSSSIKKSVEDFWKGRKCKADEPLESSTMLGSCDGDEKKLKKETQDEVDFIKQYLKKSDNVLDLGCGYGRLTIPLSEEVRSIDAVDFSEEFINFLDRKDIPNISAIKDDVVSYVNNKSYDVVIMSGLFPCVDDSQIEKLINSLQNNIKQGGKLILRASVGVKERINVINQYSEKLNSFYTAFYRTEEEIDSLLTKAKFEKITSQKMYQNHNDTKIIMSAFNFNL